MDNLIKAVGFEKLGALEVGLRLSVFFFGDFYVSLGKSPYLFPSPLPPPPKKNSSTVSKMEGKVAVNFFKKKA